MSKSKPENPVREKHSEKPQQKRSTYNYRGGSWIYSSSNLQAAFRDYRYYRPSYYGKLGGFRIARTKK